MDCLCNVVPGFGREFVALRTVNLFCLFGPHAGIGVALHHIERDHLHETCVLGGGEQFFNVSNQIVSPVWFTQDWPEHLDGAIGGYMGLTS